ncbi:MAG: hypothetical protein H0W83_17160 [Planctomycetes bacterium]|nr:hypothetical protein [Planctomycetota bacterium]
MIPPKPTFFDYVAAAFNARPMGMFIPPNWIGVAAVGLLGLLNPGIWVAGAGLELGYLVWLIHQPRFRRVVDGRAMRSVDDEWKLKLMTQVARLSKPDLAKYRALEARCQGIIEQQVQANPGQSGVEAQADGLSRLLWIYLRLLVTLASIVRIGEDDDGPRLEERARALEKQLAATNLGDDLRKSLAGQLDILRQRLTKRKEATDKRAFVEAETQRIEEQVELIREQAMLAGDAQSVSNRIDEVAATLGGTNDWIRDQQQMFGQVEDILTSPPPLLSPRPMQREVT